MGDLEFSFLAPEKPLNANQRLHWAARNGRTEAWRNAAYIYASKARIGPKHGGMPWDRPGLGEELVSALETRAIWGRYGL